MLVYVIKYNVGMPIFGAVFVKLLILHMSFLCADEIDIVNSDSEYESLESGSDGCDTVNSPRGSSNKENGSDVCMDLFSSEDL